MLSDTMTKTVEMREFKLRGCEIVSSLSFDEVMEIIEQNDGYHTAPVKLSREMVDKMKRVENSINAELYCQGYLDEDDIDEDGVKIVHGNVVFAETSVSTVHPKTLTVTTVFINDQLQPHVKLSVN